ncbi:MAG: hypothetical protein JSW64_05360 [Candidatus Zixiibacteriota bacterium]|nr:MAG: hypothetical protein JSW64_05360 [candidate division Zixibacteria bacterium]
MKDYTFLGIGLNIEKYSNASFMPFYIDFRSVSSEESMLRPYLFLNAGYAIGFVKGASGGNQGGPLGAVGFGIGFRLGERTFLSPEVGFKLQEHMLGSRKELLVGLTFGSFRNESE